MKKLLRATLLVLGLSVLPNSARAFGFNGGPLPYKVEAGANAYFRIHKHPYGYGGQQQLGPWYQYWPLEAHFQTQAPGAYPNWPQPYSLPPGFRPPVPTPLPGFQPPAPTQLPPFQPPAPQPLPYNK